VVDVCTFVLETPGMGKNKRDEKGLTPPARLYCTIIAQMLKEQGGPVGVDAVAVRAQVAFRQARRACKNLEARGFIEGGKTQRDPIRAVKEGLLDEVASEAGAGGAEVTDHG
jgi:predicted transcriptional regulator